MYENTRIYWEMFIRALAPATQPNLVVAVDYATNATTWIRCHPAGIQLAMYNEELATYNELNQSYEESCSSYIYL